MFLSQICHSYVSHQVLQPSQKSDEHIAKEINSKLGYTPGISYTDIANRADQAGRKQLAIKVDFIDSLCQTLSGLSLFIMVAAVLHCYPHTMLEKTGVI